jgi:hypothetical protein
MFGTLKNIMHYFTISSTANKKNEGGEFFSVVVALLPGTR